MPISYYRLTQTDFNGTSESFKIIAIYFKNINEIIKNGKIVPNPFKESFEMLFDAETDQNVRLDIITNTGTKMYSENLNIKSGSNNYHYQTPSGFKDGIYYLMITGKNGLLYSSKIICNSNKL